MSPLVQFLLQVSAYIVITQGVRKINLSRITLANCRIKTEPIPYTCTGQGATTFRKFWPLRDKIRDKIRDKMGAPTTPVELEFLSSKHYGNFPMVTQREVMSTRNVSEGILKDLFVQEQFAPRNLKIEVCQTGTLLSRAYSPGSHMLQLRAMKFPTTYDFETKCHQFLHFCPFFSIPNAYHVLSGDQPTDQGLHCTMLLVIACGGTAKWVPFAGGVFV